MSLPIIIGLAAGIVLGGLLISMRNARPVLLPILLVLGIAGLAAVVQWHEELQSQARLNATTATYDNMVAQLSEGSRVPAARPPFGLRLPSPFFGSATGAAAPPAVRPPSRSGPAS